MDDLTEVEKDWLAESMVVYDQRTYSETETEEESPTQSRPVRGGPAKRAREEVNDVSEEPDLSHSDEDFSDITAEIRSSRWATPKIKGMMSQRRGETKKVSGESEIPGFEGCGVSDSDDSLSLEQITKKRLRKGKGKRKKKRASSGSMR